MTAHSQRLLHPLARPHPARIFPAGHHQCPNLYAQKARKDPPPPPPPLERQPSPSLREGVPGEKGPPVIQAPSLTPTSSTFPSSGTPWLTKRLDLDRSTALRPLPSTSWEAAPLYSL